MAREIFVTNVPDIGLDKKEALLKHTLIFGLPEYVYRVKKNGQGLFPGHGLFLEAIILYHITDLRKQATQRPSGMMECPGEAGKPKK